MILTKSLLRKIVSTFLVFAMIISIFAFVGTTTAGAADYQLYVRGSFNSWGATEDFHMTNQGNDDYSLTVTLPAGDYEYKISTADWGSPTIPSGDNASFSISDKCQVLFLCNPTKGTFSANPVSQLTIDSAYGVQFTSCWMEHNDAELSLSDDGSSVTYVTKSDSNYKTANKEWNLLKTSEAGIYYLQNAKTNGYVYADGTSVRCSESGNSSDAGKWKIDTSTGSKRFVCYSDNNKSITIEDLGGVAKIGTFPADYTSSQWKMTYSDYGYSLYKDKVVDTQSTATATSGKSITSNANGITKTWTMSEDTSSAPVFSAPNTPLAEAVYNLSMEETFKNMFQSTYGTALYTGTAWHKVWTRDTAMACQYSLAWAFPDISYNCQREKIVGNSQNNYVFMEDTGTGGSYPVSTDKIITMLSVWETYLSNGNTDKLSFFYDVCANTIAQDQNSAFDAKSGLFNGETCGLDWRDQTYPDWMSAETYESLSNIAESKAASVNMIYCEVAEIMAKAAKILNKGTSDIDKYQKLHDDLEKAITTQLWDKEEGLYVSWQYPEYMGSVNAKKYDVIANGYALWFGIGSEAQLQSISENYPLTNYGAETCYPQKEGQFTYGANVYHNKSVWPGWEATMMIGGKYQGNNTLAEECWDSNIFGAATWLTNKEVLDYETGEGLCSDRQLWSIGGTLGGYYRVLYGMNYSEEGISFDPYVPDWMEGPFTLSNYTYQGATLTMNLTGKGDTVTSIKVNGQEKGADYVLPTSTKGNVTIDIVVSDSGKTDKVNKSSSNIFVVPTMPTMSYSNGTLKWTQNSDYTYKLWTGKEYVNVSGGSYKVDTSVYGAYSLIAVNSEGIESELSRPIIVSPTSTKLQAENNYSGGSSAGSGLIRSTSTNNCVVTLSYTAQVAGRYQISALFNNVGDATSGVNCGMRSVYLDGVDVGAIVFPETYNSLQTSTHLSLDLTAGTHSIVIKYDNANFYDRNMGEAEGKPTSVDYDYFTIEKITDVTSGNKMGDVNGDGDINIKDATEIQKLLVELPCTVDESVADVNKDSEINIKDVTTIQQFIAGIVKDF